jgi:alpha-D-ribose 1-methylphosphonate 5-triphosphate synthase subunit PhnG
VTLEREVRLEAISLAPQLALEELADQVLQTLEVDVARGPTVGLLMMRIEEPSERLQFNFSELTVSEAEVTAHGLRGYAMVMGRQPEKALAGAILDLALELEHPAAPEIERCLEESLAGERRRRELALARVAPTRVRFEEMAP